MLTTEHVREWFEAAFRLLRENKDQLTELDSAIGDGDHGLNMVRGFEVLHKQLPELAKTPLRQMVKGVGMVLLSNVGGVSGPLYGTFFLKGSEYIGDKDALDAQELHEFLRQGLEGLRGRGRTERNDKTMYDVWEPAVAAYGEAVLAGKPMGAALEAAVQAAKQGMEATIPLLANKGRASYLGERSIGHQDPGATSSYYIIKALRQSIGG